MGLSGINIWQLLILMALPLYLLPSIIAFARNHPYKLPILLVNVFGGVIGGLGWVVALVWCFVLPDGARHTPRDALSEIEQLHSLKERGILTQQEFDAKKKSLLS